MPEKKLEELKSVASGEWEMLSGARYSHRKDTSYELSGSSSPFNLCA